MAGLRIFHVLINFMNQRNADDLQKAWADFQKARADLQRDIPGFVDVIDKHEALVRLRLDQLERRIAARYDLKEKLVAAARFVRARLWWAAALLAVVAVALTSALEETRESCIEAASKRTTDAGVRYAINECNRKKF